MGLPSEDDRDAINRAFAELVAGYHLTADPPDPFTSEPPTEPVTAPSVPDVADRTVSWASDHPLFGVAEAPADAYSSSDESFQDRYVPEPLPPLRRPGVPALLGWIGIGYAIIIVLAATFGLRFPAWTGWIAVGSFVGGFGILMTRLPRDRPPDAGNGAVI
jgi:hypothetical protein